MPKAASTKLKSKSNPSSPPALSPSKALPKPTASRETMVQILLAKVENRKTLDWFDLSVKFNKGNAPSDISKKGGKRRKSAGEDGECLSGNELRDVFHEVLLPSLKRGVLPWEEDGPKGSSTGLVTPPGEDEVVAGAKAHLKPKAAIKRKPMNDRGRPKAKGGKAATSQEGRSDAENGEELEEETENYEPDFEEEEPM